MPEDREDYDTGENDEDKAPKLKLKLNDNISRIIVKLDRLKRPCPFESEIHPNCDACQLCDQVDSYLLEMPKDLLDKFPHFAHEKMRQMESARRNIDTSEDT
jgi:hypothetical protein